MMNKYELKALVIELIALAQRNDILPTDTEDLADELQSLVANEMYIPKAELIDFMS